MFFRCSFACASLHHQHASPYGEAGYSLLRSLDDQVDSQAILDAVLIQSVPVFQDFPSEDQHQLVLLGFEPPRDLLFKLEAQNKPLLALI